MSLSDAAKASAQGKPTIWREIKARLSTTRSEPRWLPAGQHRSRRRLCRMLIAQLLCDELSVHRR